MGSVFGPYEVSCLGEVIVRAILPFPYLNLFYGCVTATTVCVTDEAKFEEADKVGFVCGGS
jgi:methyl coenzyme M reductase subunit D